MEDFLDIATVHDVGIGQVRAIQIGDRKIALYRTAKGFFATDNSCPHRGGPLAEGDLMGDEIICPWHLWNFNVESGATEITPDLCLIRHEVRLEGDRVLVRLSPVPAPQEDAY